MSTNSFARSGPVSRFGPDHSFRNAAAPAAIPTHGTDTPQPLGFDALVDAPTLLALLWHDNARPSLRWLRDQQRRRTMPFIKISGKVFFSPTAVRAALDQRHTVGRRS